jgi:N5-(cytidine 5'-diphosphoramidyl)-L-glutamine hydrolase
VQSPRDRLEEKLLRASLELQWPVFGVCRGMQALNVFHGGRLEAVVGHVRTRHGLETGASTSFSLDRDVNSYHGFGIPLNGVASGFEVLASAGDTVEAIWNSKIRHLGVMWHPERNVPFSQNDLELFRILFH